MTVCGIRLRLFRLIGFFLICRLASDKMRHFSNLTHMACIHAGDLRLISFHNKKSGAVTCTRFYRKNKGTWMCYFFSPLCLRLWPCCMK